MNLWSNALASQSNALTSWRKVLTQWSNGLSRSRNVLTARRNALNPSKNALISRIFTLPTAPTEREHTSNDLINNNLCNSDHQRRDPLHLDRGKSDATLAHRIVLLRIGWGERWPKVG